MRSLRLLSGLVCGAGLSVVARASAQTPDARAPRTVANGSAQAQRYTVAVVANPARSALIARLHAELNDLGFRVEEAPAALDSEALDALTDGTHFLALVRVDELAQAIDFRIRAPESGELLRDRVDLRSRRVDVAVVATAELLRARLIKLGILHAAPEAPPPPPPPAPLPPPPTPVPPTVPSVSADVNAGAWYSAGGLGTSPALVLGLRVHPKRWLALGALGALQPRSAELSATEGQIQSRAMLVGALGDIRFGSGHTSCEVGAGVALSILSLSGQAGAPYAGRDTHSYGIAPLARANVGFRLTSAVSLHTSFLGGVSSPRISVRFADRTVAHWGRPFALALIGLEVGF